MEKILKKVNFVQQNLESLLGLLDSAPPNAAAYRGPIVSFIDGDLAALKKALAGEAIGNGGPVKGAEAPAAKARGRDDVLKTVGDLFSTKGSKPAFFIGENGDEHVELITRLVARKRDAGESAVLLDVSTMQGSITTQTLQGALCTAIGNEFGVSSDSYSLSEIWSGIISAAGKAARHGPVVVVLTQLDCLREAELAQVLPWICDKLASAVRLVVTCDQDGPVACQVEDRRNIELLQLPRQPGSMREKFVAQHVNHLSAEIVADLARMEHSHLASYLRLAGQCISSAAGADKEAVVRSLPGTLLGMYKQAMLNAETAHDFKLVGSAIGLIMTSACGLTVAELTALLKKGPGKVDESTITGLITCLDAVLASGPMGEKKIGSWLTAAEMRSRYKIRKADEVKYHQELGDFFLNESQKESQNARVAVGAVFHLAAASSWSKLAELLESVGTNPATAPQIVAEVLPVLASSFSSDAVKKVLQLVACCSFSGLSDELAKQHLAGNGTALAVLGTGVPAKLGASAFRAAVMVESTISKKEFKETHAALAELVGALGESDEQKRDVAYHGMMANDASNETVAAFTEAMKESSSLLAQQGDDLLLTPLRILKYDEAQISALRTAFGIAARLSPSVMFQVTADGMGQVLGGATPLANLAVVSALSDEIKSSTKLAGLRLAGTGLSDQGITKLADGLWENNSLTAINLSGNPFGVQGVNALGRCLKPNIQHLIIDDQLVPQNSKKDPVRLVNVPPHLTNAGLTRQVLLSSSKPLDVSNLNAGEREVNMLLGYLRVNPSLTELTISKSPLPLGVLRGSEKVKEVKLTNVKLNAGDCMVIAAMLKYNSTVQDLQLGYNGIGPTGATAIAEGIKECKSLTKLVCNNNSVGNDGAAAILAALKGSKIKELWLSFNMIDDEGIKTLAPLLSELPNLADLRLGANKIGEDGAITLSDALGKCPKLTDLWLGGNKLGASGKAALNEKKPEKLNLHF